MDSSIVYLICITNKHFIAIGVVYGRLMLIGVQ